MKGKPTALTASRETFNTLLTSPRLTYTTGVKQIADFIRNAKVLLALTILRAINQFKSIFATMTTGKRWKGCVIKTRENRFARL